MTDQHLLDTIKAAIAEKGDKTTGDVLKDVQQATGVEEKRVAQVWADWTYGGVC